MNALSAIDQTLHELSDYLALGVDVPTGTIESAVEKLKLLSCDLQTLETHIQATLDVNDALAMALLMMDVAHDRKLDADKLRCLLAPLGEKLGSAVEGMRELV